MKNLVLSLFAFLIALSSFAQQVSHATFYSKEGYPFTIYLNGQKMNEEPQTEVRLINLTQPYYSCEAIFEDPALEPAKRKLLQLTDAHGNRVDVTFVVERNRKGKMKIGWKSQSRFPRYIEEPRPEPTVVVVNNGVGSQEVVRQTTTTRTVESNTDGVNMSFGGIGGRVNINTGYTDPIVEEVTTTTTTVVPSSNSSNAGTSQLPCGGTILGDADYEMALKSVAVRSSEEGKLTSAKQIVSTNCFTTDQARRMVELLNTEAGRLDLAIFAYPYVLDKGSYFKMNGVFAEEKSIDQMNKSILGQ
jgi:hypothetical protein